MYISLMQSDYGLFTINFNVLCIECKEICAEIICEINLDLSKLLTMNLVLSLTHRTKFKPY